MNDLTLNPQQCIDSLAKFIQKTVNGAGYLKVVLGLSGGIDSSLSAFLSVRALGADNVLGLRLPYQTSSPGSLAHAQLVIDELGIPSKTIDITSGVEAILENHPEATPLRRGNIMARVRMIHVYDQSAAFPGLVVGTGNKTETLLGYSTLHGDGAFDFNPLADLYKAQVRQLSKELKVPKEIIDKAPSADLWIGQTDEEELGYTYNDMDRLLFALVEDKLTTAECIKKGFNEKFVSEIVSRVKRYRYKSTLPLVGSVGQYAISDLDQLPFFND
jgi:NAD+ synthase